MMHYYFCSYQRSSLGSNIAGRASGGRTIDIVLADVKEKLAARGVRGIVALQRRFKIMDDDNSGTINQEEFKKAMRECNIQLTEEVLYQQIIVILILFISIFGYWFVVKWNYVAFVLGLSSFVQFL